MKKGKYIKFVSLMLLISMLFTGCGGKKTNGDLLELTVWNVNGSEYVAPAEIKENIVEDWLVEKTGVKVTNIYGNDGGQWDSKLAKLIAGDNLPDIVTVGSGQGMSHFLKLKELKKLHTITEDEIKKYAPDIWKQIPEEHWEKLSVDGEIYGIPFDYNYASIETGFTNFELSQDDIDYMSQYLKTPVNDTMPAGGSCFWIRDDILQKIYPDAKSYDDLVKLLEEKNEPLDEVLLDIPIYTTDEYVEFMRKIKALNLKENNRTVYAFGYDGGDNWLPLAMLGADMMGYKGSNYMGIWNSATQEIEIPMSHKEGLIKEAVRIQNKLINEKVIDPESIAHTLDMYRQKILAGQYAIIPRGYLGMDINQELENMGVKYRYRPFITQVPCLDGYEMKHDITSLTGWGSTFCVLNTLSKEEMHKVLQWANVQFTDEYQKIKSWGPEDANLYVEKEDGKLEFKDERFTRYFLYDDKSALTEQETLGLGGSSQGGQYVGLFSISPTSISRWSPKVMYRYRNLLPLETSGFNFKIDSPHVTSIKPQPPFMIWLGDYATDPGMVELWSSRGQWEDNIKKCFVAKDDKEFEQRWATSVKYLNEITDMKELEERLTKIGRKYLQ